MQIITLVSESFQENTYLIIDDNKTVIIDPGIDIHLIKREISQRQLKIKYILLTHGHYDHILSAPELNTVIYAHEDEKLMLNDAEMNLSIYISNKKIFLKNIKYFSGEVYELDNFEIYHTPGHTAGSVIIKAGNNLFTGDTLFFDTVGRTDLPSGNLKLLQESLKIFNKFDKDIICYPGHGSAFKLSEAFKYNYFLKKT